VWLLGYDGVDEEELQANLGILRHDVMVKESTVEKD